ncbi:MAG: hypothetical protein D6708_15120 [Candidatus Dadabacteria bacterium]|nr:MAG: hypothetical protein D6708_15120 [Candidatus Dadabacteria bacterium]
MATVNFSVPEEVKRAFNETFAGRNKSAIIARLMMEAVEEERRRVRRAKAVDALLELRAAAPAVTEDQLLDAREKTRP